MILATIDTHALIWCIIGDTRLSQPARLVIRQAATEKKQIALSTITLVEIIYLKEKGRIPENLLQELLTELDSPRTIFTLIPIDRAIIMTMQAIHRDDIPDMPNRLIAATSLAIGVSLISRDRKIQCSQIPTIW